MAWRRDLILDRLAGRDVVIPDEPPRVELPPPSLDVGVSLDSPAVALPAPDTTQLDTVPPPDTTSADTASAGRARDTIPAPGAR
jgi:hypothetical protein